MLRVRDAAGTGVTQFEALTAAAFCAFAAAGVEWGVVEAGLGGRLDATNVLARSRVQVLTNVVSSTRSFSVRPARRSRPRSWRSCLPGATLSWASRGGRAPQAGRRGW